MNHDVNADLMTSKTLLLIQARPIVAFSPWLVRAHLDAQRTGRTLTIVTRPNAELTLAAARFVARTKTMWIIDHPDGSYDGLTGSAVTWDGDAFTSSDEVHPAFVTRAPTDERALTVVAETMHSYQENPVLGDFSLRILDALGFAAPTRWGAFEPLTQAYSTAEITEYARNRSPQDTMAVTSGPGGDALIMSIPQPSGVVEKLEFSGPRATDFTRSHLEASLTAALNAGASHITIGYRQGLQGRMVSPRLLHELMPLALAIPESAVLHTSLDRLVARIQALDVGEVAYLHGRPSGMAVYFTQEDVSIPTLHKQYGSVLLAVMQPESRDKAPGDGS